MLAATAKHKCWKSIVQILYYNNKNSNTKCAQLMKCDKE